MAPKVETMALTSETVDVVVIGAGLAGLSAAYRFRDFEVLILERERRVGGRVLTISNPFSPVDLGACFAVGPDVFPSGQPPEVEIPERGPIGILRNGKLYLADTAWECIEKMPWDSVSQARLSQFHDGCIRADALPDAALEVVNALFKQIHPGHICDYIPERQQDAFNPLYPNHYPSGNGLSVDAYLHAMGDRVHVSLGHVAVALRETPRDVTVVYQASDLKERKQVTCQAVIVATTADVARSLVRPTNARCAELLASVRYGTYTVVGLVIEAPELPRFRYLVSPDQPLNVIVQQSSQDCRYRTLLCYFSDPLARAAALLSDAELLETTLRQLAPFGISRLERSQVRFSTVRRWDAVGTILSPIYARLKTAESSQATSRVFLAGDYLSTDMVWGYGTVDAVKSGRATADLVCARLASDRS